MKKLFLFVAMVASVHLGTAQTIHLSENFEGTTGTALPANWTSGQQVVNTAIWRTGTEATLGSQYFDIPVPSAGARIAALNDDAAGASSINNGDSLLSPNINIVAGGPNDSIYLFFDSFFPQWTEASGSDTAFIALSDDNGATWTPFLLPVSDQWQSLSLNLGPAVAQTLKIAFVYKDNSLFGSGLAVDNIRVITPAVNDVALVGYDRLAMQEYQVQNTPFNLVVFVQNTGGTPLAEYELAYQVDGGPVQSQIIFPGTAIPNQGTVSSTYPTPIPVPNVACSNVKVWVGKPNDTPGGGDESDDTLTFSFCGLSQAPASKTLLERFVSTQNGFSSNADFFTYDVLANNPSAVALAWHHQLNGTPPFDAMVTPDEANLRTGFNIQFFPTTLSDRFDYDEGIYTYGMPAYDGNQTNNVPLNLYNFRQDDNRPASLSLVNVWDAATRTATTEVTATFFGNLPGKTFRLGYFVTEDSILQTGAGYDQASSYNNTAGHPLNGDGNPVLGYLHRNVVRGTGLDIANGSNADVFGSINSIAGPITDGYTITRTFTYEVPAGQDTSKMWIVATVHGWGANLNVRRVWNTATMRINMNTNADTSSIADQNAFNASMAVMPNPADDFSSLNFELTQPQSVAVTVFDQLGREVLSLPSVRYAAGSHYVTLDVRNLPAGVYNVRAMSDAFAGTTRLIVR